MEHSVFRGTVVGDWFTLGNLVGEPFAGLSGIPVILDDEQFNSIPVPTTDVTEKVIRFC